MDEAALVACCKDNMAAAQKVLYMKYAEDMMILCVRYVASEEDAKEVLMDGFLSLFKNIKAFAYRGDGSLKAWLKKIMVNQCLMHLRKRSRLIWESGYAAVDETAESRELIMDCLSAKEIMSMIHSLPEGYRTVFNLYVFEGYNHREIGEILSIDEGTSKSQFHRAKAILKQRILQTV